MINENCEIITGRLGRDPYLAYTKKGNPICEMSVGLQSEQNQTVWRKIVVFGKLAELCKVHLKKGNEVFVRGPVALKRFFNRDGVEREYFVVHALSVAQSLF